MHFSRFPDFSTRSDQNEIMDGGDIDPKTAQRTLAQFKLINFLLSRSRKLMKAILIPHMLQAGGKKLTLLDIGAGGGDIALWFANLCRAHAIDIKILCLDHDPQVVEFASKRLHHCKCVSVRHGSAHEIEALDETIDYIFANHFLHHLSSREIPQFIEKVYTKARRGFLINDLVRSRLAYLGFTLLAGIFFHGSYHLHDGRLSIRKGFRLPELKEMVAQLNFADCVKVGYRIPARVYLYCFKDGLSG
jgi:2-polyprenyl-3-methyl-5-hydroxy-6-metoxy-1,4-benzoquinol methylase